MARYQLHHHACQDCGAKTECGGQIEQNYDGSPEWICGEFHLPGGDINGDFICEGCAWKREDEANAQAEWLIGDSGECR